MTNLNLEVIKSYSEDDIKSFFFSFIKTLYAKFKNTYSLEEFANFVAPKIEEIVSKLTEDNLTNIENILEEELLSFIMSDEERAIKIISDFTNHHLLGNNVKNSIQKLTKFLDDLHYNPMEDVIIKLFKRNKILDILRSIL